MSRPTAEFVIRTDQGGAGPGAQSAPEFMQFISGPLVDPQGVSTGQQRRIHGPGAGATEALEAEPLLLQQAIQHYPGKRPMGSTPLQGQTGDSQRFRHGLTPLARCSIASRYPALHGRLIDIFI